MHYITWIPDQCRKDAGRHGVLDRVQGIAQRIESNQSISGLEAHPAGLYKKRLGNRRLVIYALPFEFENGRYTVLVFLRVLQRGDSEYGRLLEDPAGFRERNTPSVEAIEAQASQRLQAAPEVRAMALSEEESVYLHTGGAPAYIGCQTYLESHEWVDRMARQDWAQDRLRRYSDLVEEIENGRDRPAGDVLVHPRETDARILYRRYPDERLVWLIAPLDPADPDRDTQALKDHAMYRPLLATSNPDRNALYEASRRAYPDLVIYDPDAWRGLQSSQQANLALSPEEERILDHMLHGGGYPLFINGRPGSGKSTLLQYLFADQLVRFFETWGPESAVAPPLYLTYSDSLLETARRTVEEILRYGAAHLDNERVRGWIEDPDQRSRLLGSAFQTFESFLRMRLPDRDQGRFPLYRRMGLREFRALWEPIRLKHGDNMVRRIGAELAWHVIRTYIQGMRDEEDQAFTPENYAELPEDRRSVSLETFERVHQFAWKVYGERRKQGWWDDQDLAHAVLQQDLERLAVHPAVFCDEAQDFTHLELSLIQSMILYARRSIQPHEAPRVPLAFAGDPFQTLNPTGFDWGAVQARFYESVARRLDPTGGLQFNYQELGFNYRCAPDIVRFVNLIQLLRGVVLNRDAQPQQHWGAKIAAMPARFELNDGHFTQALREQEELVIIVPCQEGDERDYVERHDALRKIAMDARGRLVRNVLSPTRAKGLEYARVLLYGFGAAAGEVPGLVDAVAGRRDMPSAEERLQWEYFLNGLYVAVSRARKRLLVADAAEDIERFWWFAEPGAIPQLLARYKDPERWNEDEDLGGWIEGGSESFEADRDDPRRLAEMWEERGRQERDAYLMGLAALNYERAGSPERAVWCAAFQAELQGESAQAARRFAAHGFLKDALRCHWNAKAFPEVADLGAGTADSSVKGDARTVAAVLLRQADLAPQTVREVLGRVRERLSALESEAELAAWRAWLSALIERLAPTTDEDASVLWRPVADGLEQLARDTALEAGDCAGLARLWVRAGEPCRAVSFWDTHCAGRQADGKWLLRARADCADYPERLRYLADLEDYGTALDQWRAEGAAVVSGLPIDSLVRAALAMQDEEAMRILLPHLDRLDRLAEVVERFPAVRGMDLLALQAVSRILVQQGGARAALAFVGDDTRKGAIGDAALDNALERAGIHWGMELRAAAVIRALARQDPPVEKADPVRAFLRDWILLPTAWDASDQKTLSEAEVLERVHRRQRVLALLEQEEAGAAMERWGRITDALVFYEMYFRGRTRTILDPNAVQRRFALERWIYRKRRQIEAERQRGREEKAAAYEEELQDLLGSADLEEDPLAPELPPLGQYAPLDPRRLDAIQLWAPSAERSESSLTGRGRGTQRRLARPPRRRSVIELSGRRLRVTPIPAKGRVRVEDEATGDELRCDSKGVASEDLEVTPVDGEPGHWQVPTWGLACRIGPGGRIELLEHDTGRSLYVWPGATGATAPDPDEDRNAEGG